MRKPDLSRTPPEVVAYIEYLEKAIQVKKPVSIPEPDEQSPVEILEPPSSSNVITISRDGYAKRTPRHLYPRQRRGGMGIFDLDASGNDVPAFLVVLDKGQNLLVFSNRARAFLIPYQHLSETPVRSRGQDILQRISLEPDESLAAVLPSKGAGYVILVSKRGMVRSLRHHLFGEYLKPGSAMYNYREFGELAAACWAPGNADVLIATRLGQAIRFAEKNIPPQGILGMRLETNDVPIGVAPVDDNASIFAATGDGKGTTRKMENFHANKSPGGGGKQLIRTEILIGVLPITEDDDLFMLSRLGKIIRFSAQEVPETEGIVQGVNVMSLRSDDVVAITKSTPTDQLSALTTHGSR